MTRGVYCVHLSGTPYVYVGESINCEKRFAEHAAEWAWPNAVSYTVVREMPGASKKARCRTEAALKRLLLHHGYLVWSVTHQEVGLVVLRTKRSPAEQREWWSKGGKASAASVGPERLRERGRNLGRTWIASLTPEQHRAVSRKGGLAAKRTMMSKYTHEERSAQIKQGWAKRRARLAAAQEGGAK